MTISIILKFKIQNAYLRFVKQSVKMPLWTNLGKYSGDLLGPNSTVLFRFGIFSSVLSQSGVSNANNRVLNAISPMQGVTTLNSLTALWTLERLTCLMTTARLKSDKGNTENGSDEWGPSNSVSIFKK